MGNSDVNNRDQLHCGDVIMLGVIGVYGQMRYDGSVFWCAGLRFSNMAFVL